MADITIPKDDKGFYLNFTINDSTGVAYNLTGYTITLKAWVKGTSGTLFISVACDIVVAASGTCRYLVAAGDFDVVGSYEAELELTKVGVIESTKPFIILVEESG